MFGLLFCYLTLDFVQSAKEDFFVMNYDWEYLEPKEIGLMELVDYNINSLSATSNSNVVLSNQNTYQIGLNYFRAEKIENERSRINFVGIHWINEYPRSIPQKFLLSEVNLPLLQKKGTKVAMIGDSHMAWRNGKYTRKWISNKLNVEFIGKQLDVFGFPYFYEREINSEIFTVLDQKFNEAEVLILFVDLAHFKLKDVNINFKGKEIIIVDFSLSEKQNNLSNVLIDNKTVKFINLSNYDREDLFVKNTNYLNYTGQYNLAEEIITKLKAVSVERN